jgi:hypothetical protein
MKNILSLILLISITVFYSSCKQDKSKPNSSTSAELIKPEITEVTTDNSLLTIVKNMGKVKVKQVPDMKREAKVIINHRYKQNEKKAYIILDKDLWEYEFIFTGKTMTKPGQLAGMWIDFNEDQSYSYGYYDQNYGGGIYTFDLDSGLLLLIDNSDEIKPQEFEAKLFDKSLIMDGNEIYKDNNYNAKLRRVETKPVKIG